MSKETTIKELQESQMESGLQRIIDDQIASMNYHEFEKSI